MLSVVVAVVSVYLCLCVSVFGHIVSLDQIKATTNIKFGLQHFSWGKLLFPRTRGFEYFRNIPHLNISSDQGSDMLCALFALLYFAGVKINCTLWFDPAHGCNRDFWGAALSQDLRSFLLLMMISMNVLHGPDESDHRYGQMLDIVLKHMDSTGPTLCAVYQFLHAKLLMEFDIDLETGESPEQALWYTMKGFLKGMKKGYKTNQARFLAVLADGGEMLKFWHLRLYMVTVTALREDMLQTKHLPKVKLRVEGADAASVDTTSVKKVTAGDRTLRACGANAVVLTMALLSDNENFRLLAIVTELAKPLKEWLGEASRELRDVESSRKWLVNQQKCWALIHISDIWDGVGKDKFLRLAGFLPETMGAIHAMSDEELTYENEMAQLAGSLMADLVKQRAKRLLHMLEGHPNSLAAPSLGDMGAKGLKLFQWVKKDHDLFLAAKELAEKTGNVQLQDMVDRSQFQICSMQQWVMVLQQAEYKPKSGVKEFALERFTSTFSSQAVEDINNRMKNTRQVHNFGGRYRRPLFCYASAIRSNALTSGHKYIELPPQQGPMQGPLVREDLHPMQEPVFPLGSIETTTEKTPYFSPKAENVGLPVADRHVLRAMEKEMGSVHKLWAGFFCHAQHSIIFRSKKAKAGDVLKSWVFPLYHYKKSACLVWPVELQCPPKHKDQYIVFKRMVDELQWVVITDHTAIECLEVQWKCWAWQVKRFPHVLHDLWGKKLRAFIKENDKLTVQHVAAKNAWWSMTKADVELLMEDLQISLAGCTTAFDVFFKATKEVLQISDSQVMDILQKRMAKLLLSAKRMQDIQNVDEAAQVLRGDDQDAVKKDKVKQSERAAAAAEFRNQYKAKARIHLPNARARKAQLAYKGPSKVPNFDHIEQEHIKVMLPPGGLIWRVRAIDGWMSRYKELPPQQFRDASFDTQWLCAQAALQYSWEQCLPLFGMDNADCPVQGLFS